MSVHKYIKKPIVVEAIQFTGDNKQDIFDFLGGKVPSTEEYVVVPTLEGNMRLKKNCYLIKGIKDEFYPCNEEIFNETYELVE